MPIDVEHGHEEQHLLLQRAAQHLALEEVAQRPEAGVLAVNFAGMDTTLHQHHRQFHLPRTFRRERPALWDTTNTFMGRPSGVVPKSWH